eukprot:CAMPEP_0116830446 /NCGR_PEP_ID=MMETSP0418-20121206/4766_1 /TAXON_ID=1158023 /ORGANISM="Astrosyne radiata, Strain 13vi08-1A" /LENGTH=562 /DNA_ID=CAMNT_0004459547 /DNA_START=75 /DNA_END=1764 /DNA_ORIENTATION=+
MAQMVVAEAMTNLFGARKMYKACTALKESLIAVGIGIDGGKDSLSMAAKCGKEIVKAPGELTLTCYVTCPDITKIVTPDVKPSGSSKLLWIDLSHGHARLGGSALGQVYKQLGNECPNIQDFAVLKNAFEVTQTLIDEDLILAGHDRSDGGLIVTLLEMAFAGNCSIDIQLPGGKDVFSTLFNEEAGIALQVSTENVEKVQQAYSSFGIDCIDIGMPHFEDGDFIKIRVGEDICLDAPMTQLRNVWESTGFELEKRQRNPECVRQEQEGLASRKAPAWKLTYTPQSTPPEILSNRKHKVAILRQEGSNGDREMISAFLTAGLEAWDVTVRDLLDGSVTLDMFRGIVLVGGFSFADVLDSGKGWAGVIRFDSNLKRQFEAFHQRSDTFSLGICNGCQLMALLGWIPGIGIQDESKQPRLLHNASGKFESRFVSVKISPSPAVLLKGMEESSLGVWVAHGEGRFHFPDDAVYQGVLEKDLAPIRYVNDDNQISERYPFNPNGSPAGLAALCSEDGRHLAMMPHPERVFKSWQWPWTPPEWKDYQEGAWLKMFQNARLFCEGEQQ